MEVTIYIDVLWLRTFLVELNVCIFVNLWMKQKCPTARILWMCALTVSLEVLLFVVAGYGAADAGGMGGKDGCHAGQVVLQEEHT